MSQNITNKKNKKITKVQEKIKKTTYNGARPKNKKDQEIIVMQIRNNPIRFIQQVGASLKPFFGKTQREKSKDMIKEA